MSVLTARTLILVLNAVIIVLKIWLSALDAAFLLLLMSYQSAGQQRMSPATGRTVGLGPRTSSTG